MRSVIAALLLACAAGVAAQEPALAPPVIVVSGEATVQRAPDRAFITVAAESRAKSPRDAQRQNADAMTAVQKRLTDAGVSKDALRTVGLRLEQEFDTANGRRTPRGFLARNTLELRVDDVARAGELADVAVGNGATSLDGIRFDLKDRAAAEREALGLAVADARARAEAAAAGAGRVVDRILRIEEGAEPRQVRPVGMARMQMMEAVTIVEPGLIDITSQVTLTVSMK